MQGAWVGVGQQQRESDKELYINVLFRYLFEISVSHFLVCCVINPLQRITMHHSKFDYSQDTRSSKCRWNTPWNYYDDINTLDKSKLLRCNETLLGENATMYDYFLKTGSGP